MNFVFNSYFIRINEFKNEKFFSNIEPSELNLPQPLVNLLEEMQIDKNKPSYFKKSKNGIYIKYHICGEIVRFDTPRSPNLDPDVQFVDGLHPIYKMDEDENIEIYFTESIEMKEPFLDDSAFEMNITINNF